MPSSPEVIGGMRQPRSVRLDDIRKSTEAANALPTPALAADGITVYVSPYRKYRVQVTAPSGFIDPVSGRKNTGGKMYVAEFDEGVFRNNHRDPAVRKLFDESLQSNPYFGKFGGGPKVDFWLATDQNATTEAARVKSAMATLKSLPPETVKAYMAELAQGTADDHTPEPVAAKPSIRPIAQPA